MLKQLDAHVSSASEEGGGERGEGVRGRKRGRGRG
jgi:hypothetical protein